MVISLVRYKNKAMPKVSVIIPVYNVEKYIERCARSLFEQTLNDMEYIFVNDCTPDQSMQILSSILTEYPNRLKQVLIINQPSNTGQSGARRRGMELATGDYIIHCDADDWVELDMYEKMYVNALETGADAVCCDIVLEFNNHHTHLKYNSKFPDHQLMYDCIAPISVEYYSMCNRLISKRIYDKYAIEPFSGVNMWDDVGLSIRFRYYIQNNIVINESLYHYNRINETSTTRRPVLERVNEQVVCVKELEKFFEKVGGKQLYKRFISQIKLVAKEVLFDFNPDLWRSTFSEVNRDISIVKQNCSKMRFFKYILVIYGGKFGVFLINMIRFMKHFTKRVL